MQLNRILVLYPDIEFAGIDYLRVQNFRVGDIAVKSVRKAGQIALH